MSATIGFGGLPRNTPKVLWCQIPHESRDAVAGEQPCAAAIAFAVVQPAGANDRQRRPVFASTPDEQHCCCLLYYICETADSILASKFEGAMSHHSNASLPAPVQQPPSSEPPPVVRDRYDWTLISLEAEYPALDPDSSEFDEDLMFEVWRRLKQLVAGGLAPARALELAAAQVLRASSAH